MNGDPTKIEILKPFEQAFELMKQILFRPFDLKKWLVIGFAAFLSGHVGGFSPPIGNLHPHGANQAWNPNVSDQLKPWLPAFFIGFFIVIFALAILLLWLRARGNFILTDCVVRNRAAIVSPWREYRKEGNSYFQFQLGIMLVSFVVLGLAAVAVFSLGLFSGWSAHRVNGVAVGIGFALLFIIWLTVSFFLSIILHFMPPVMYIRRCGAVDAFREVLQLVTAKPIPFILFCLFGIVLVIGLIMASGMVTCVTCCLAALPYIGTVILLPAYVWLRSFTLLFFRQFGPDYDVWAGQPPPNELPPPQISPPPLPQS